MMSDGSESRIDDVDQGDFDPNNSIPNGVSSLPRGLFMSAREAFHFMNITTEVFEECPPGNKSNTCFLVDNKHNLERSAKGLKRHFYDDCGVWDSRKGKTHTHSYILDDFRIVFQKDGLYGLKQKKGNQLVFKPLDPQPIPTDVVTMHRYETCLKSNVNFKKHVSYFESELNPKLGEIAVYEYSGTYSVGCTGNVRSNPKTLDAIRKEIEYKTPEDIFMDMSNDNPSLAPKDKKQIRNVIYREKQKQKMAESLKTKNELTQVISMVDGHPFCQKVVCGKNQQLSVLCYTDEQITDLQTYLKTFLHPIVCVDRTFNVGCSFVTLLLYKSNRFIVKETGEFASFIGPVFFHKDRTYQSYRSMFCPISDEMQLTEIELRVPDDLEFGSEEQKALTMALEQTFPDSSIRLCIQNLKDNVQKYLQLITVSPDVSEIILDKIFGSTGVINAHCSLEFEKRCLEVTQASLEFEEFATYFETQLKSIFNTYVFQHKRMENNAKEVSREGNQVNSSDDMFEGVSDLEDKTIPSVITKMYEAVQNQLGNMMSAFCSSGDYELTSDYRHYCVSEEEWNSKSEEEKQEHFLSLLLDKRNILETKIEITDDIQPSKRRKT